MSNPHADRLIEYLVASGIKDQRVLDAIHHLPRERFVSQAMMHQAYDNNALPIGQGQTISQPYIVARMTELLELEPSSNVLEIGTGSGYQTAVLAQLVERVYSVERIKSLQWEAKRRLKQLDIYNISTKHGDGWLGWETKGPFDAIIVTAAAEVIPQALLAQLKDGGRMVIPVGETEQQLLKIERKGDEYLSTVVEMVRFVPLVAGDLA
ncbi:MULTISPECIES: protein-L-isoaspartate(D-aspartate) O-methyltransferase [Vibrio]|jgi:protein-L-isoaspartate(D-aspartate) O-methyltransferase|uniref:Protein-L-isoaspartate O-methyltransferase n=1 Tax=Vibrio natriegens NBRC 15636 = ATCC 14048 = DSM 759 TaxID=1219067 RepID=A0AAN0Y4J1_VIBNA|nr:MULTISPECIES: protein-L-isoaspartate(D-aspartate) O-methyltransferase [Vibrio]MEE3880648.1 protein-L-isoaspartate(D-aspartate) O-methyltransferase [Vibrio sp. YYF0003]CAH0524741.1 Protein-L-isoaspartate O-methyltransferase [Catenococcus thiocycli]AEX23113.1 protein-L-isoaspartate O-methyltransferase [Vibrio sp. EJY3]ALR14647.1 protein-L-isoaspartate O-methyltransferase [Vibrio natriegens NBRC 15636 = ATCC 14048 = DSM 759]ANQ13487.1 protein-L-isoaspartate O-methyltransferase [Vibrio natriege